MNKSVAYAGFYHRRGSAKPEGRVMRPEGPKVGVRFLGGSATSYLSGRAV